MAGIASHPSGRLELAPRPPFRLDLTVWALRRRARNQVDRWDGSYHRTLLVGERAVPVTVDQTGRPGDPTLRVQLGGPGPYEAAEVDDAARQVTGLLGLDVDLHGFYEVADRHAITRPLKDRFLGLRPPRFPTLFEAMVNAVANQQLSLESGLTMLNRLVDTCGSDPGGGRASRTFPTPEAVLATPPRTIRGLGFSDRKTDYLLGIAHAIVTGDLDADELRASTRDDAAAQLLAVRGIGRWSAEYVLLRGLGRLDVYPGDDVGARNKLRRFMGLDHDPGYDEIAERLLPWQPWAGMLYFHLLLDGLVERGDIERSQLSPTIASGRRRRYPSSSS